MQKAALRTAGTVFLGVGAVHVWRLATKAEVMIGPAMIPPSWSILGALVAFTLSTWMFCSAKK